MAKEKTTLELVPAKPVRAFGQLDEIRSLYVEGRTYNLDDLTDVQLQFLLEKKAIEVVDALPAQV